MEYGKFNLADNRVRNGANSNVGRLSFREQTNVRHTGPRARQRTGPPLTVHPFDGYARNATWELRESLSSD